MDQVNKPLNSKLEKELDALKDKIGVMRGTGWQKNWKDAIGMPPIDFYRILSKDLPEDLYISVDLSSGGQGSFEMHSALFNAERRFSRMHGTLYLEELRVKEKARRQGLGKKIFKNHLELAEKWGLKTINVRGGREDGPYFWSKRGAFLEDSPVLKQRFMNKVKENFEELSLLPEEKEKIEQVLQEDNIKANFELACIAHDKEGLPLGVGLLKGTNPRLQFHLDDKEQMKLVKKTL